MSNSHRFQVRVSRKLAIACGAAIAAGWVGAFQGHLYASVAPNPAALYAFGVTNNTGSAQGEFQVYVKHDLASAGAISSYINSFASPSSSASYSALEAVTTIAFTSTSHGTIASGSSGYFGYVAADGGGSFFPGGATPVSGGAWLASPTAEPAAVDLVNIYDSVQPLAALIQDPYIVIKANVAPSSNPSATTTEYFESAYTTSPNNIEISNNTGDTLTLSDIGYYLSPTQIPLDQLNLTDLPPSDFTQPLNTSGQNGSTLNLAPNSSTNFVDLPAPEPAALLLCAAGCGILLLRRRQRS